MEHKAWSIDGGLPTADSAEVSEFTRLFGFYKPNVAMRDIVLRPACIVPLMLACIASMAYLVTASPQLASQGNRALQETAGIAVNVCVRTLLSAGLLTLYASAVSHAPVQFRQVFAVVSYARMPGVVFTVLAIVLILMRRAAGLPGPAIPLNLHAHESRGLPGPSPLLRRSSIHSRALGGLRRLLGAVVVDGSGLEAGFAAFLSRGELAPW